MTRHLPTAQMLISQRIEDLRLSKGLTRAQVAAGIRKSQAQMSLFLRGMRSISLDVLDDLADFFGVPVGTFLESAADPHLAMTAQERQVAEAYRHADSRTQRAVEALLEVEGHHSTFLPELVDTVLGSEGEGSPRPWPAAADDLFDRAVAADSAKHRRRR
jgi:transcriptional regulator with XRE-family HTH domain